MADSRILGQALKLIRFHPMSPGMPFFLPRGTIVFNRLMQFLRQSYSRHGYEEVITPQIYNTDLWRQSGHLQYYQDDMYFLSKRENDSSFGLKPMNCPGHCLIYGMETRSYRDLPLRLMEFTALHRNELSGSVCGLSRVRRFHQDDAHIFIAPSQLSSEIQGCLSLVKEIYGHFGMKYEVSLSTCPEKALIAAAHRLQFLGDIEDWKRSETILREILSSDGHSFVVNDRDGAFYGPKIDIYVTDSLLRKHQTATVQLDFQFPKRFDLKYKDADGSEKSPVIIHRAIIGSLERFLSIYLEHTNGNLPFWMSPYQLLLLPVSERHREHCAALKKRLQLPEVLVDVDDSDRSLNKRIKMGEELKYNYIGVVGDAEIGNGTLSIRQKGEELVVHSVDHFRSVMKKASLSGE